MANKRILKKSINSIVDELFMECLFYCLYLPKEHSEQIEKVMTKIAVMQNEFINRANNVGGKDNSKIVKRYYSKLKEDFLNSIHEITEDMDNLCQIISENVNITN